MDRIHFRTKINDSVQIGDLLYQTVLVNGQATTGPVEVGIIRDIGPLNGPNPRTWVEVDDGDAPTGFIGANQEWVDNGTFDTILAPWSVPVGMTGDHIWDSGRLFLQDVGNLAESGATSQFGITTVIGEEYTFSFSYVVERGVLGYLVRADDWSHFESDTQFAGEDGVVEHTFIATDTNYVISFQGTFPYVINPTDAYIDNVSLINTESNMDILFSFRKNNQSNISTLVGYFGEVTLTQNSPDKRELFAIGSEIFVSSK